MKILFNKLLHKICRLLNINRWYMRNLNNEYCWWRLKYEFEWERIGWEEEY